MIEFYFEHTQSTDDLLSLDHLLSICRWEKKFKHMLSLENSSSLSLATFVALYSAKNDCQLITAEDIENFRSILHKCLPYYIDGYMDIPLSDKFLNRIQLEHQPGFITYQEQTKAVYTALRHMCFYKNITRFVYDHFVDKQFINDFQRSNNKSKVSISMILVSNYDIIKYNRTRDRTMCLRRQPYSINYCEKHGCIDDYRNNFVQKSCSDNKSTIENCKKYCQCKYECQNETEELLLLMPKLKAADFIEIFGKNFANRGQLAKYKDQYIRLIAFNLAHTREKIAMAQIRTGQF